MDTAHAARALFGGDARDIARRAIHEIIDERFLSNLGLRRANGGGSSALAWLAVGTVVGVGVGAAAVYLLADNGDTHRKMLLAWARASMRRPNGATTAGDSVNNDDGTSRRGSSRPRTASHS